jgi:hypothetical protein
MENTKILKADKYQAVIDILAEQGADELVKFVQSELDRHTKRQEAAKVRASKKKEESDTLTNVVLEVVKEIGEPATRDEITRKVEAAYDGDIDVTASKVGARLTKLINAGEIEKAQRTINKGRKIVYATKGILETEEEAEEPATAGIM